MLPHLLTNFVIQIYYQNEPRFNGVYARNNLPKIKDGAYVMNLDQYKSIGTHWIVFYVNDGNVGPTCDATYFGSIVHILVEHILKEIKKFIGNRNNVSILL